MRLKWKDDVSECGRFMINACATRYGRKWESEFQLCRSEAPEGKGPPFTGRGGIFDTRREAKARAEELAAEEAARVSS